MYQLALRTYINIIIFICHFISKKFNQITFIFAPNSSNPFHIFPTYNYQLSSHPTFCLMCSIRLSTLQLYFNIPISSLLSLTPQVIFFNFCNKIKSSILHLFRNTYKVVTRTVSSTCARTNLYKVLFNRFHIFKSHFHIVREF
jgi:hypothetical protein